MLRQLAAIVCTGWLAVGASLPTLHAHVYAGHDHPEHHHGPAFHTHARPAAGQPDAHGRMPARVGPCDPDEHTLQFAATVVDGKGAAALFVAPARNASSVATGRVASPVGPRDVRAHSPPRVTDGPLRAPPASHPA